MKTILYSLILLFFIQILNVHTENLLWKEINGSKWDPINQVLIDNKGNYYVATYTYPDGKKTYGGLYKSIDSGMTWTYLNISSKNYGVNQILITKKGLLVALQDFDGISISSDEGATWKNLKSQFSNPSVKNIVEMSNGTLVVCTYPNGVYKSLDGGYNWTKVMDIIPGTNDFHKLINIKDVLFRLDYYCVFKSTDAGSTWTWVKTLLKREFTTVNSFNNCIYVSDVNRIIFKMDYLDDTLKIFKTNKYFYSIKDLIVIPDDEIIITPNNGNFPYIFDSAGTMKEIVVKNDNPLLQNEKIVCTQIINNELFFGFNSGSLYRYLSDSIKYSYINQNNKHYNINKNIKNQKVTGLITDTNFILTVLDSISLNVSKNDGKSWYPLTEENYKFKKIKSVAIDGKRNIYAIIDSDFFRIENNLIRTKLHDGLNGNILSLFNDKELNVYAITDTGIYIFNILSSKWDLIVDKPGNFQVLNNKNNNIFIKDSSDIFVFSTKERRLLKLINIPSDASRATCAEITDDSTIFIGFNLTGLYKTKDYGKTWIKSDKNLTNSSYRSICSIDNTKIIVGTFANGIYYSNNSGDIWEKSSKGLTLSQIVKLDESPDGSIYCGTWGKGVFKLDSIFDNKIENIARWNDSIKFKQENLVLPSIIKVKYTVDGKKFITYSKDNAIRIWDLSSGELISEYTLSISNIVDVDLNENENWIAIATNDSISGTYDNHTFIYDYVNDIYRNFVLPQSNGPIRYNNYKVLFANNQRDIINNIKQRIFFGFSDLATDTTTGINYLFSIDSASSYYTMKRGFALTMKMGKKDNLVYFMGNESWWWNYAQKAGSGSLQFPIFININISNYKYNYNIFSDLVDFSGDDNYFAYLNEKTNKVVLLNYKDSIYENRIIYNNNDSTNLLNDLAFNYNGLDLYFSTTNKLYHWCHFGNAILDSFDLPGQNGEKWNILFSKNSKYLLLTSNYGHIRLYDVDKVMSAEDKKQNKQYEILVTPNPATDFIQINIPVGVQLAVPKKIEIYDILGVPYTPPNPLLIEGEQLRLDVSGFVPGVYFVKIGDKVQRFVKV